MHYLLENILPITLFCGNSGLYLVLKNVSFIVTVIEGGLNRLDISFELGVTLEDAPKTTCHP